MSSPLRRRLRRTALALSLGAAAALPLAAQTTAPSASDPNATPTAPGPADGSTLRVPPPLGGDATAPGRMDRMSGNSDYGRDGWSLLPGTRRGYVGLNLGRPDYRLDNGTGVFDSDDPDARLHLYTGGLFSDWLGMEFGYLNEGKAERAGGTTRAQGLNVSLVLRAPIQQFSVFGKLGATYGRTRVSSNVLSGVEDGRETGWGRSLGVGVGFDLTPSSGVVVEWSRNRFRFPGDVKDDVDATSVGFLYRF